MLLTIVSALVLLGVLIIFHEFGHFLFAKKAGIRVDEFSIGFGPKIIQKKKGETMYKVCLIPLGGYVKLAGMDPGEVSGKPDEFASKSAIAKTGTVLAGPVFSCLLSLLLFIGMYLFFGIPTIPTTVVKSASSDLLASGDEIVSVSGEKVETWANMIEGLLSVDSAKCVVRRNDQLLEITLSGDVELDPLVPAVMGTVVKGGPGWKAGLRKGDMIVSVNEEDIQDWDTLVTVIQGSPGEELLVGWLRDGSYMEAVAVPQREQGLVDGKVQDIGMLKIASVTVKKPVGVGTAINQGFLQTVGVVSLTFSFFKKLIVREVSPKNLGGAISIVKFAGESARWGLERYISFMAFLSIQLFIFNLIPIPPLDGGHILLIIIEKIKRSPISEKTMKLVQNIGVALFILLMVCITFNDIVRLIGK
jgi:regulator of sigma E protease